MGKASRSLASSEAKIVSISISEKNIRREKEPKLSAFEQEVADLKIRHFKIAKGTPELNGKVERFNRTIKKAMQNRLWNGVTLFEAQKIVDE